VELVLTRRSHEDDGAVAVFSAILFASLFTIAAMVVQFGFTRDVQQGSQNAADASALAAAYAVAKPWPAPDLDAAVDVAIRYANTNFGTLDSDWSSCTDSAHLSHTTARTGCVSFDKPVSPTKVRVVIPSVETKTGVGGGAGVTSLPVSRAAEAAVVPGVGMTCGLCFLGPVDSGNADYTVTGGSIAVAGDVDLGPNGHMTSTGGTVSVSGTARGGGYSPNPPTQIPFFTDPWASRTDLPPATAGLSPKSDPCSANAAAGGQGVYGDVEIPKDTCTLQPGLYVITGAWTEKNNSVLAGTGVTLYFTCGTKTAPHVCASGEDGGSLDAKNGDVTFSAPVTTSSTRAVPDVAIVYDRFNAASIGLQGNGGTSVSGGIYAPSSALDFNGNSCFGFGGGPVIVNGVIKANGNKSCVNVTDPHAATYAHQVGTVNLTR
jgi:hypothetical protein